MTGSSAPVFYDVEASSLDGFPIEIGWARADLASGTILSEGHLIRPPPDWDVRGTWDASAAGRHRIALDELWRAGRPVLEIARRMNDALRGSELFADSGIAPPNHRAEADARHWAVLWAIIARRA